MQEYKFYERRKRYLEYETKELELKMLNNINVRITATSLSELNNMIDSVPEYTYAIVQGEDNIYIKHNNSFVRVLNKHVYSHKEDTPSLEIIQERVCGIEIFFFIDNAPTLRY